MRDLSTSGEWRGKVPDFSLEISVVLFRPLMLVRAALGWGSKV